LKHEEAVPTAPQHRFHGAISKLARNAAFRANRLGGIGSSLVVRIFSITPSMK
jgi:hypothetical protein